jgi:hypothetical protein
MVHPSALTGKTTHSLLNIIKAVRDLVFREYNKDARPGKVSYRDAGLPPFKKALLGQPTVIPALPSVAVEIPEVLWSDAPQDAGSDDRADIKIFLYGSKMTREPQLEESIKMVDCVRQIIIDNPTVPTKEGTERVFQLGYGESRANFDRLVDNFGEEEIGVEVALITLTAVWAETGF